MIYKVTVTEPTTKTAIRESVFDTELKAEFFAMMCELKGLICKVEKIVKQGLTNLNPYDIINT